MSKIKTLPETPSCAMDSHTYDLKKMSALPRLSSSNPNHIYLITQWMQSTTMVEWIYRSLEKCSSPTIIKWLCFHSVCLLCAFGSRCPDDLTKKYWCHANNILQIHRWGCVVLQVMHHVLVTLLMTPPSQQLCQISKLPKHFLDAIKFWYRLQFQFPRSSEAPFVCHVGWLQNWKLV